MIIRKPDWLRVRMKTTPEFYRVSSILSKYRVHTICKEALCPNIYECWGSGTATFLILGDICTRNCRFCSVKKGNPGGVIDEDEPSRVALAARELGLKYVVITSVDRDDLPDGGACQYAKTIKAVREHIDNVVIEVLTPDFQESYNSIKTVVDAKPDVYAHNIETVERLTPVIRDRRAAYKRSLKVLRIVKDIDDSMITKSSILVGFGEKPYEVIKALEDLRNVGVDIVTIGQYLQPTTKHFPVAEYVEPKTFKYYEEIGYKLGFKLVISGPLVRSSYLASKYYDEFIRKLKGDPSSVH